MTASQAILKAGVQARNEEHSFPCLRGSVGKMEDITILPLFFLSTEGPIYLLFIKIVLQRLSLAIDCYTVTVNCNLYK